MKQRNFPEDISKYTLWQSLANCYHSDIPVVGTIINYNDHFGYTVEIDGIHAEMRRYDISSAYINDFESYVGKTFLFNIIHIDTLRHTLKVSRKTLVSNLKAGMLARGIVTEIIGNRMHIDVGFLARVNIKDMADFFIKDINDIFHEGQFIDIVLLEDYNAEKYTEATSKASEVWAARKNSLQNLKLLNASVIDVSEVGIKVNILDYYDGFIHRNFLTDSLKERLSSNMIKVGESIEVAISNFNDAERKVLLSTLQVQKIKKDQAWETFVLDIKRDQILTGIVEKIAETNGLVVRFNEFVTGYIPYSQLNQELKELLDSEISLIGMTIEAAVSSYSASKYKLYLSVTRTTELKQINEWEDLFVDKQVNDILSATVSEVAETEISVRLGDFTYCRLPIKYLSNNFQKRIKNEINIVGENILVAIIRIDQDKRKIQVSMKRVEELSQQEAECKLKSMIEKGNILSGTVIEVQRKYALVQIEGTDVVTRINREELSTNKIVDATSEVYSGQTVNVVYLGEEDGKMVFSRRLLTTSIYSKNLYNLSLSELLVKQGIDKNLFIGRSVRVGDDVFFHDVASVGSKFDGQTFFEGRLLQDYITAQTSIVRVHDKKIAMELKENSFYQFSITLANNNIRNSQGSPFIYQTSPDTPIHSIENPYKKEVELVFSKQDSPESNKIIASLLREVGSQLYSEKSRMLFELLQNADDAAPSRFQEEEEITPMVQVCIDVREEGILFQHNGCAFNFEDFRSITSAANSTKGVKKKSTGYKGIGFKSVFTNSQSVFIHSKGFQFLFDRNNPIFDYTRFDELYRKVRNITSGGEAQKFFSKYSEIRQNYKGIDDIPWQIMPFWDESERISLNTKTNDNVVIGLLMDEASRDEYRSAIQEVFDNPRMFLFLRHTRRIQFKSLDQSKPLTIHKNYDLEKQIITLTHTGITTLNEKYKLFNISEIEISDSAFEKAGIGIKIKCEERNGIVEYSFVEISNGIEGKKVNNIPDKIASANSTTISFAFVFNEKGEICPVNYKNIQSSLYAYLPMNEQRFKFPFFINADFVLSSNREGLQADNRWNIFLFYQLGKSVVEAVISVASVAYPKYLSLLPEPLGTDQVATRDISISFNNSYLEALDTQKFILDENKALRSQTEIILDKTGLSNIIGNGIFRALIGSEKYLPYNAIDTRPLSREFFKLIDTVNFDTINQHLINAEDISAINEWLINVESDEKSINHFYEWLTMHADQLNVPEIVNNLQIIDVGNSVISLNQLSVGNTLILSKEAFEISDLLKKLYISCNTTDLSSHILKEFIKFSENTDIYDRLIETDLSVLDYPDRLRLFLSLEKMDGIGESRRKKIQIFNSVNGSLISLDEALIIPDRLNIEQLPYWYSDYVVAQNEMCSDITTYLPVSSKENFEIAFSIFTTKENTSINEFYNFFREEKVWNSSNTEKLIEKYGASEEILFIVEDSDNDRKEQYLKKIEKFSLSSSQQYTAESFEYRVLDLSISSGNSQLLRNKTFIDNIPLSQYAVSDVVTYIQNNITYRLQLSEVLPSFSSGNALGKIKKMFSAIHNTETFFTQEEKNKVSLRNEFISYLRESARTLNWTQIAFIALENRNGYNWNSLRNYMHLPTNESILTIFNPFSDYGWSDLLKTFISISGTILTGIKGKYYESKNFTLPEERVPEFIEDWISNPDKHEQRTKLLLDINAYSSTSNEIKRRKRFLGDTNSDVDWGISGNSVTVFCNWLIKTQELPITSQRQKEIIKTLAEKAPKIIVTEFDDTRLAKAYEYDDECYENWSKTASISIYLIDGNIPRVYKFNDMVLYGFDDGKIDYYNAKRIIYVNSNCDIEAQMMIMAGQSGVPFDKNNWSELFSVKRSAFKKEQEEKLRLQAEIEQLREQLSGDVAKRQKPGKSDENDQKELNRMARYRAKDYLLSKGYECQEWDPETPQRVYHTKKDGKDIAFAVASCRGGLVYLHTYKFAILMESPHNLLLIDDGNIVQSLSFEDAFKSDSNVNLIFDIDYIIPSSMARIANMMQAFPKTRFVFDKPNHSISDEIRTFGLNEKHEGAAPIIESMDELD